VYKTVFLFIQDKQTGWLLAIAIEFWSVSTGFTLMTLTY